MQCNTCNTIDACKTAYSTTTTSMMMLLMIIVIMMMMIKRNRTRWIRKREAEDEHDYDDITVMSSVLQMKAREVTIRKTNVDGIYLSSIYDECPKCVKDTQMIGNVYSQPLYNIELYVNCPRQTA